MNLSKAEMRELTKEDLAIIKERIKGLVLAQYATLNKLPDNDDPKLIPMIEENYMLAAREIYEKRLNQE